jgi:hypothetical protein
LARNARWYTAVVGLGVVLAVVAGGCADSKSSGSTSPAGGISTTTAALIPVGKAPVLIEQIRPAIAAVEKALGGPQRYFEVNATPTLVNVYVAESNATRAVAYVFMTGTLQAPAAPQGAGGPTFGAADLTFDETRVMATVVGSLPNSTFRLFSAVGVQHGGVSYVVTVDSALGGELEITLGPTGIILGTNQQLIPDTAVPAP